MCTLTRITVIKRSLTVILCAFLALSLCFGSSAEPLMDIIYFRFWFADTGATNYQVTTFGDGDQVYNMGTTPIYLGIRYFNSDILSPAKYIFSLSFQAAATTVFSEDDFSLKLGKFDSVVERIIFTNSIFAVGSDPTLSVDGNVYTVTFVISEGYDDELQKNNALMLYINGYTGNMFYMLNTHFGLLSEFDTDKYQSDVLQNMNTIKDGLDNMGDQLGEMNNQLDHMNDTFDNLLKDELGMIQDSVPPEEGGGIAMDVQGSNMWKFLDSIIDVISTNETLDKIPLPQIIIPSMKYGNAHTPSVPLLPEDPEDRAINISGLLNSDPIKLLRAGSYVMYTIFFIGFIIDYQRDLISRFSLSSSEFSHRSINELTSPGSGPRLTYNDSGETQKIRHKARDRGDINF